nr:site-specific DNA-methyltransferase [Glaesserella parasuis]
MNLLQARYREQVKCIYIDPPYNTGGDGFIYKDSYQHSSWLSLMSSRLELSRNLMNRSSLIYQSINDNEEDKLKILNKEIFNVDNFVADLIWANKEGGGSSDSKLFRIKHEHILAFARDINNIEIIGNAISNEDRYKSEDEYFSIRGKYYLQKLGMGSIQYSASLDYPIEVPDGSFVMPADNNNGKKACWRWSKDKFEQNKKAGFIEIKKNKEGIWIIYTKQYMNCDNDGNPIIRTQKPMGIIDEYSSTQASKLLDCLGLGHEFNYSKPIGLLHYLIARLHLNNQIILDYFAGSGTTAHAVINLNREDNGNRQYILVEQGEYFDTVLKPRVQKVVYSKAWKEGKPVAEDGAENLQGVPQIVKVLKLESYEDTLNNLELRRSGLFDNLSDDVQQDYLLHYMLNLESRGSLLNVSHFEKPFDYGLNISTTSAGAYEWQKVDLVETFNYLIGARLVSIDDQRVKRGYVAIDCQLPNQSGDDKTLIVWRDCEQWHYENLYAEKEFSHNFQDSKTTLFGKINFNPKNTDYAQVYINGDHTLETVWDGEQSGSLKIISIEDAFLSLMFEGDA